MRAGILKYSIKLIQSQSTRDSAGSTTETWVEYANVRAGLIYKGGEKSIVDFERFNSSKIDFTIRYDKNINEQMRVIYESKTYKIASIYKNPFDNSLTVNCELINN